jgi:hypothetical protein
LCLDLVGNPVVLDSDTTKRHISTAVLHMFAYDRTNHADTNEKDVDIAFGTTRRTIIPHPDVHRDTNDKEDQHGDAINSVDIK